MKKVELEKRKYAAPQLEVIKMSTPPMLNSVSSESGIGYGGTDDSDDGIYGD